MKRLSLVLLLLAFSLAAASNAAAQVRNGAKTSSQQAAEKAYLAAVANHPDRWIYRTPGGDPIVTASEIRCGLSEAGTPEAISVSKDQYVAFWNGTHDACSEKSLLPISGRLKRRLFLLMHEGVGVEVRHDPDNDPGFEKLYSAWMDALGGPNAAEDAFGPMDARLTLLETNGSKEPGHLSQRPPTPYNFTFHAFVSPAIPVDDGVYEGRAIRFVAISYAELAGRVKEPCFNLSGMFAQRPPPPTEAVVEAPPPPAPAPLVFPPPPPLAPQPTVVVREEHHSHKGLWITIGVAAGTAVAVAALTSHGSKATAIATVIVNNPTVYVPVTPGKAPQPTPTPPGRPGG